MSTLIVHPDSEEKLTALKAVMNALKISYEVKEENSYDPQFVAKVLKGDHDKGAGKGVRLNVDDIWK